MDMHEDQVEVAAGTVRVLIADQFPAWAGLDVREVRSAATDNAIFRIGDDLAARFPLRREDPDRLRTLLAAEAAAARELALVSPSRRPSPLPSASRGTGIRHRGASRPGCPGATRQSRTLPGPSASPRTWPHSWPVSGPRTRRDDVSVAAAGVAT